ncbi:MAG: acyl-CoA desaturase [Planctomycetaceae bacterium]
MSSELLAPPKSSHPRRAAARPSARRRSPDHTPAEADREEIFAAFRRGNLTWRNVDWVVLTWMAAMHAGALAAPFFFDWTALAVTLVLHWLTCSIGICLGYHRYLSHKSLKLAAPAEFFVLLCGAISGEGSPLTWAATHRLHHARSDKDGDPHSPLDGPWWSHVFWLFVRRTPQQQERLFQRYVPELQDRPMLRFFERTYFYWLVATGVVLFLAGGWPMLLWGLCVRMVFAYHSTWFVNSATHLWGYRSYDTRDESRNLWWVAVLSYGEGWHNNHHAHPANARAGHRWWEIDMTYWAIKLLKTCRLARDVRDDIPQPAADSRSPQEQGLLN